MSNDFQHEIDDPIEKIREARKKERKMWLAVGGVIVALIGLLPIAFGVGPFGIGVMGKDQINVWIYNTTIEDDVEAAIRRKAPLASEDRFTLGAYETTSTFIPTGARELTTTVAGKTETFDVAFRNHTFLSVGGALCYAVFDITEMYNEAAATQPAFSVVDRIAQGQVVYESKARTMVPPRARMPKTAHSPVHWVEDFDCGLLAPELEDVLKLRAQATLQAREAPEESP